MFRSKSRLNKKRTTKSSGTLQCEQLEVRKVLSAVSVAQAHDVLPEDQVDASAYADIADNDRSAALAGTVQRIVNGTQTNGYEAVGIVNDQCTGTLIAPNAVLTAAHCVEGMSASNGSFEVGGQTYSTKSFHVHPNADADLAVMILNEDVQGITPYQLNRTTPYVGQMLTLVGFGATGNGNSGHNGSFGVKHEGQTPIDQITNDLIIWNFDNNNESNTAPGDSGGPAFVELDGQLFIAGVTSGGDRADAAIGDTSYDGRVDSFVNWIDDVAGTSGDNGGGGGNEGGGGGNEGGGGGNEGGGGENNGQTTGVFSSQGTQKIPGNRVVTVNVPVEVSGMSGGLVDIDVKLNINHTWNEDLQVTLISPAGTRIELFDAVGEDNNNFRNTVFDDDATESIYDGEAPFRGTFLPGEDLNLLNGEDPNGTWTLEVVDHFELDGGRVKKVELKVTTDGSGNDGGNNNGDDLDQLAIEVDTEHDLYFNGNEFFNWGGKNEKWMNGDAGWYFITPDGSFYEWDYSGGANGQLIATFDETFHDDPSLLYNAADTKRVAQVATVQANEELTQLAAEADDRLDLQFTGDYFEDWAGGGEKWLMSNQGWTYLTQDGDLFAWSGTGRELSGDLIVELSTEFYDNPDLLHNATATGAALVDSVFAAASEDDDLFSTI